MWKKANRGDQSEESSDCCEVTNGDYELVGGNGIETSIRGHGSGDDARDDSGMHKDSSSCSSGTSKRTSNGGFEELYFLKRNNWGISVRGSLSSRYSRKH